MYAKSICHIVSSKGDFHLVRDENYQLTGQRQLAGSPFLYASCHLTIHLLFSPCYYGIIKNIH